MEPVSMVAIILTSIVIIGTLALVGSTVFGVLTFATYTFVGKNYKTDKAKVLTPREQRVAQTQATVNSVGLSNHVGQPSMNGITPSVR
jgi:hypothetical protein